MNIKPDMYKKSIYDINYEKLKEKNIKYLFFDLDNTIIEYNKNHIDDVALNLFKSLENNGFKCIIFSNISYKKLCKIDNMMNIEIHYSSMKPLKKEYKKVLEKYNKDECAFIGDQMMTDVLGAKRNDLFVILVDRISYIEPFGTKIFRFFEKIILRKLKRKNILVRGCYYD